MMTKPTTNALAKLLDETRNATGMSDPDVARRAQKAGHTLTKSNLSRIRLTPIKQIVPDLIYAMAAGLSLPPHTVLRAALETVGLPAGEASTSPESATRADLGLSDGTKRAILAILRDARKEVPEPA